MILPHNKASLYDQPINQVAESNSFHPAPNPMPSGLLQSCCMQMVFYIRPEGSVMFGLFHTIGAGDRLQSQQASAKCAVGSSHHPHSGSFNWSEPSPASPHHGAALATPSKWWRVVSGKLEDHRDTDMSPHHSPTSAPL